MLALPQQQMEENEKLYLMFSSEAEEKARQESEGYSNNIASWNAYRHRLCLETFLDWLKEFVEDSEEQLEPWPAEADLPSFWEVLEGAAIQWEDTRILLIGVETEELETFSIPREWVDIFAADYYVAAKVNLDEEESGMEICGYITHRELKKRGQYNEKERSYFIPTEELIEDIDMMLMARQFVRNRKGAVKPWVALTPNRAEILLEELSDRSIDYPRTKVNFEEWGGLLINDDWRQQLYEKRLAKARGEIQVETTNKLSEQVGQWLSNFAEEGWQTVEEILRTVSGQEPFFTYSFAGSNFRDNNISVPTAVPALIDLLRTRKEPETRLPALQLLGQIGYGNSEAIAFLSEMLENSQEEEMRRHIAITIGQLEPNHPLAGVRRVKMINLGMQLEESQVALAVTLVPEGREGTNVHLQVYPSQQSYLPSNLKMEVLDDSGNVFLEAESRKADNWIKLELSGDRGDSFAVQLTLGEACFNKQFVL
jgi:hypothetical protein